MNPDDPDRKIAEALRLRGDPPRVVRLSRRAIFLMAGVACAAVAGVSAWALRSHPHASAQLAAEVSSRPAPPGEVAALPKDYAGLPAGVPKLGPPLPGDLGRPLLAGRTRNSEPGLAPTIAPRPPEDPRRLALEQARASRLVAGEASRTAYEAATRAPAGAADPDAPHDTARPSGRAEADRPACVLLAGSTIPAALLTGLRSDLAGAVVAQVTEDVFDSVTGACKLIPRGSRLIGDYEDKTRFGQARVLVSWARLILPDGRSIDLGGARATDPQGYAGLTDQVDHHWRQLAGATGLSTLLAIGSELQAGNSDSDIVRALRAGAAEATNDAGRQVVGKTLDVGPSLSIRPGFPVRVLLTQDLKLQPWSGA